MKQFFKFLLASILAFFICMILVFVVFIGIIASISTKKDTVIVADKSILVLNLNQVIKERSTDDLFSKIPILNENSQENIGILDFIKAVEHAKTDPKIKGIYLNVSIPQVGLATLQEIHDALISFKKSNKFIIAYSEAYNLSGYYLAATASEIYLNPVGALDFKGMASNNMFFKKALDKIGVEAQIIRVGKFKSAVEPFFLEKMSAANREQTSVYLNSIHHKILNDIALDRKIALDSVTAISKQMQIRSPEDALKLKFVDKLIYKDEVLSILKTKCSLSDEKELKYTSINEYSNSLKNEELNESKIAIIYANGEIVAGQGNDEKMGSERISEAIRKARKNKKIKAIVLRVNSPGGDAVASDVMWREVVLARKEKPVIVSMGDYAASGGYYISCAADYIVAQANTITGSIGVFGVIPNAQKLLNDKIGITFDGVKTGEFSDMGTMSRPLTDVERIVIQNNINKFYATFIHKVAEGRKKSDAQIDSIASGRVWSGTDALKIGLVDQLGGIETAIKIAAERAKLKSYSLVAYPSLINPLEQLLKDGTTKIKTNMLKEELGDGFYYYEKLKSIQQSKGIQARIPFEQELVF